MCIGFGLIITNELQVFYSKKSDSHESIIKEFKLNKLDSDINNKKIVRLGVMPLGNFMSKNINDWKVIIEDKELPEWWKNEIINELKIKNIVINEIHKGRYTDFKGNIYLNRCAELTNIPKLKAGGDIHLIDNPSLINIQGLEAGEDIYLDWCTALTNISNLKAKEDIHLNGCSSLTNMQKLKAGGDIYLYGCTGLMPLKEKYNKIYKNLIWD